MDDEIKLLGLKRWHHLNPDGKISNSLWKWVKDEWFSSWRSLWTWDGAKSDMDIGGCILKTT